MSAIKDLCREFPERGTKIIHDALVAHSWNYERTAEAFALDPTHFRRIVEELGCKDRFAVEQDAFRKRFRDPFGK
jgi:hypothetical protein